MSDKKKSVTVNIKPGTDLNDGLPPEQPEEQIPDFSDFPEEVFDDLPPLLRSATEQFSTQREREMFLIGAIGVLSGMMPNVWGVYFRQRVAPNLYCFVMGKYGTGKGSLVFSKELGEAADNYRVQLAEQATKQYDEAMLNYNRQVRLYDKGKLHDAPELPRPPRHLKLFFPANTTKTAVMQLLCENDGKGIMFETEGDTLADMLRQDYGNFSDVLRKAFHHEPVSYFRRANNEDVKITKPCLSVVLSGTDDQLKRLVPSIENGLFSRFMFYVVQGNEPFKNPFATGADDFEYHFARMSEYFCKMYKQLAGLEEPVYFTLRDEQQRRFVQHFDKQKTELRHAISADLEGTSNRLGLICYRIAMVLTVLRFPELKPGDRLKCLDTDFDNALAICDSLLQYTLYVYEMLQKDAEKKEVQQDEVKDKKSLIEEACRCKDMGMSYREIAIDLLGDKKKQSTIYSWVKRFCKSA